MILHGMILLQCKSETFIVNIYKEKKCFSNTNDIAMRNPWIKIINSNWVKMYNFIICYLKFEYPTAGGFIF